MPNAAPNSATTAAPDLAPDFAPDFATSDAILQRMMTLHPKLIDLTLDRVWRLLDALGHPEREMPPVIHVAGTNGKGSTVAMLRAGIEGAGQTVHVYTSPHLVRFHERIRVGGALIDEAHLTAILDECWEANARQPITYFEITTVAAILAFSRAPADWTLLEVGLGGRLDATNVVERPAVCVITPVDLDHQQFLGRTLDAIAAEKAGILKRGVPCVVGPQHEAGLAVIEAHAATLGAPLLARGQQWHAWQDRGRMTFQDETGLLDLSPPVLPGPHQIDNAGMALAALRHLGFDAAACEAAMTGAVWPARMQRLRRGPLAQALPGAEFWLDGGHNPAAGAVVARTLADMPRRPTWAVTGMLRTKDAAGYMRHLRPHLAGLIAVPVPGEGATLTADETAAAAAQAGIVAETAPDVATAVARIGAVQDAPRILICGSLYLAGSVLAENG